MHRCCLILASGAHTDANHSLGFVIACKSLSQIPMIDGWSPLINNHQSSLTQLTCILITLIRNSDPICRWLTPSNRRVKIPKPPICRWLDPQYPLVNCHITMGNHHRLMGKTTISMAIFNSYVSHSQRVIPSSHLPRRCWTSSKPSATATSAATWAQRRPRRPRRPRWALEPCRSAGEARWRRWRDRIWWSGPSGPVGDCGWEISRDAVWCQEMKPPILYGCGWTHTHRYIYIYIYILY